MHSPLKPDHSHKQTVPNHPEQQNTNLFLLGIRSKCLRSQYPLFIRCVYIQQAWMISMLAHSEENVRAIFFGYSKKTQSLSGVSCLSDVTVCFQRLCQGHFHQSYCLRLRSATREIFMSTPKQTIHPKDVFGENDLHLFW